MIPEKCGIPIPSGKAYDDLRSHTLHDLRLGIESNQQKKRHSVGILGMWMCLPDIKLGEAIAKG